MLEARILEPIEESDWVSPMVVQEKKQKGKIRICVDLRKLNDVCVHGPFPTSFTDEVVDNVGGYQIMLNLKKCIFYVPFGILLGPVVCKQGLMVDPTKITVIVNLEALRNVKKLRATLGHMRYYRTFIKAYAQSTVPMEKLLKKDATFCWDEGCQSSIDVLKLNMVTTLILVFPYWKKEFHVHIDASCMTLDAVLMQISEGEMNHPIAFMSRKLLKAKKN
eukprot:PITA_33553